MLKSVGLNSCSLIPTPSLCCVENSPCFALLQPREVAGINSLCSKAAGCGQFKDSFFNRGHRRSIKEPPKHQNLKTLLQVIC